MKSKKTILALAIGILLAAAMASYPMIGYAASDKSDKDSKGNSDKSDKDSKSNDDTSDKDSKSNDDTSGKDSEGNSDKSDKDSEGNSDKSSKDSEGNSDKSSKDSEGNSDKSSKDSEGNSDVSDADDRGNSDKSSQKITVCHVPPGNPAQKHTIHIAFSAWAAHKAHTNTNTQGLPHADYLGSCDSLPATSTTSPETLHVISGCTGTYRDKLVTKVHSYFEPITVADTSLDDELVVTAMSQCLDKGDSSDSSDSNEKGHDNSKTLSGGKGRGHDSVSDSGNHHRIRGCQNKDTHIADSSKHGVSDSDKNAANKNYHKKLKNIDSSHDTTNGNKDPIVVSDSSLDDSDVWKEYKECAKVASNSKKLDSSKTGKKKGDSGHKQHVLKSCGDSQDQKVKAAITAYRAKSSSKDIILNDTSYNDVSIHQIAMDCIDPGKGGGTDTPTSPTTSTSTGVSGRLNYREDTSPLKN